MANSIVKELATIVSVINNGGFYYIKNGNPVVVDKKGKEYKVNSLIKAALSAKGVNPEEPFATDTFSGKGFTGVSDQKLLVPQSSKVNINLTDTPSELGNMGFGTIPLTQEQELQAYPDFKLSKESGIVNNIKQPKDDIKQPKDDIKKPEPEPEIPIGKPRGTGMIKQALPEGLQAKLMPFKKLNYETKFAPFNALYGGGASKNTGDAIGKSAAVIGGGIGAGLLDVANNALVNQFLINQANKFGGGKIQFNKSTGKYEVIKGKNDLTPEEMMAQNKNAVEMAKIASNEKIANLKLEEILTRIAANNAKKVKKVNQKPQQGSGQAQVKTNPYNPQTEPAEYGAWNIDNNK